MKKIFFGFLMFAAMLTPAVLSSCSEDNNGTKTPVEDKNLSGSIPEGTVRTLDPSVEYALVGPYIVENGATLNIPAGTVIKANKGFSNYILVLQGGKINISGTAQAPVTMTANISNATAGHWGGLIINGKAPLAGGTIGSTEINSAYSYGGTVANDNSGSITYLKLEYTGSRSSADVEHNGLTLNGVGSGTTIENIYVPNGSDDGVEFFGGTVNVKNLLVVNPDDDMFDFTQGYKGTLENAYGIWEAGYTSSESDPRGIEADGNLDGNFPTHTDQSDFIVRNMTIDLRLAAVTTGDSDKPKRMQDGIKIRRGAKANIVNALVKGTGTVEDLVDLTDSKGGADAGTIINITNSLTNAPGRLTNPVEAPGVTIGTGNTGCATSLFAWTGYQF
jgi:predicted secreted protein